jgi:hypothetical protein
MRHNQNKPTTRFTRATKEVNAYYKSLGYKSRLDFEAKASKIEKQTAQTLFEITK